MNNNFFARIARSTANAVAHPIAFVGAIVIVLVWAAWGPSVDYSATWQLVINTGTTILTFLMIFLLQNTQNRDSRAMHIKLDELLRAIRGARTELVDLENVTEEELTKYCEEFRNLHQQYAKILAKRGTKIAFPTDAAITADDTPAARPRRRAARRA